jgi:hypothetical protein
VTAGKAEPDPDVEAAIAAAHACPDCDSTLRYSVSVEHSSTCLHARPASSPVDPDPDVGAEFCRRFFVGDLHGCARLKAERGTDRLLDDLLLHILRPGGVCDPEGAGEDGE